LVTLVLGGLGAIAGALGGVLIVSLFTFVSFLNPASRPLINADDLWFFTYIATLIGTSAGVILGPLFAWTLLRRAPLWRAIGETALAASLGAWLGIFLPVIPQAPFTLAVACAVGAAIRLRRAVRLRGAIEAAEQLPLAAS